jgi:hypothetical protein
MLTPFELNGWIPAVGTPTLLLVDVAGEREQVAIRRVPRVQARE